MKENWPVWLGAVACAMALSGLITAMMVPALVRLAPRWGAVDRPGGRKRHAKAIPRLGGPAVAAGILLSAWTLGMVFPFLSGVRDLPQGVLVTAVLLVFMVGLLEDTAGVAPWKRLMVEACAALLIVGAGWRFEKLAIPGFGVLELEWASWALSLAWIVGVTNAVNLLDGLDGLACGVTAIISGSLLAYALLRGDGEAVLVLAAIVGACLGFLRHNWEPARIFLGDSGSLTLGFLLAAMTVQSSIKSSAAVAILVPLLALGLPVFDTLLVMAGRFIRPSQKKSLGARAKRMFRPDRIHIHYLLLDGGPGQARAVKILYFVALGFCLLALATALTKSGKLGAVLLGVEALAVLAVRFLGLQRKIRRK